MPSSSAAPFRVQAVVDALEPLTDISTQPAVLVTRTLADGSTIASYTLEGSSDLAALAQRLSQNDAYPTEPAPHIEGMEELRIECPELGWSASAYAALDEDGWELLGAWYFESPEYSGWLTAKTQEEENGDSIFADYYVMFRAWALTPAEGSANQGNAAQNP